MSFWPCPDKEPTPRKRQLGYIAELAESAIAHWGYCVQLYRVHVGVRETNLSVTRGLRWWPFFLCRVLRRASARPVRPPCLPSLLRRPFSRTADGLWFCSVKNALSALIRKALLRKILFCKALGRLTLHPKLPLHYLKREWQNHSLTVPRCAFV